MENMTQTAAAVMRMDEDRLLEKFVEAFMENADGYTTPLKVSGEPDAEMERVTGQTMPLIKLKIFSMAGDTTREEFFPGDGTVVRGGDQVNVELDSGDVAKFVFSDCSRLTDSGTEYQVLYAYADQ